MAAGLSTAGDALAQAREAFTRGDLPGAVGVLRSYLEENSDPEARLDLARLLLPLGAYDEAREQLETAFREFTDAAATRRAALAASHIGSLYLSWIGNRVAGRAWLARAWRMIEQEEPCLERGWIATWDVGCQYEDPDDLGRRAEIALETARSFGDPSLEVKALADGGLAMVEAGEIKSGMDRLDEAMTLVTSGHADPFTGGQATCSFFVACWCTGDLARLEAWCEPLRQRGLGSDRVRAVQLLAVLVEAELGRDDLGSAREAATELRSRAAATRAPALLAEARFASACVHAASGNTEEAIADLDDALQDLGDTDVPL